MDHIWPNESGSRHIKIKPNIPNATVSYIYRHNEVCVGYGRIKEIAFSSSIITILIYLDTGVPAEYVGMRYILDGFGGDEIISIDFD